MVDLFRKFKTSTLAEASALGGTIAGPILLQILNILGVSQESRYARLKIAGFYFVCN
jgi:hypothetical protein